MHYQLAETRSRRGGRRANSMIILGLDQRSRGRTTMRKMTRAKRRTTERKSSQKTFCCIKGFCAKIEAEDEPACIKAGGFLVASCTDCK